MLAERSKLSGIFVVNKVSYGERVLAGLNDVKRIFVPLATNSAT